MACCNCQGCEKNILTKVNNSLRSCLNGLPNSKLNQMKIKRTDIDLGKNAISIYVQTKDLKEIEKIPAEMGNLSFLKRYMKEKLNIDKFEIKAY